MSQFMGKCLIIAIQRKKPVLFFFLSSQDLFSGRFKELCESHVHDFASHFYGIKGLQPTLLYRKKSLGIHVSAF